MWCFLQHCALFWCLVFLHRWVECLLNTWSNQKLLVVPLPPILEVLCEGPSCQEVWGGFGTLLVHFLPQNLEGCHRLQSQKTSNYSQWGWLVQGLYYLMFWLQPPLIFAGKFISICPCYLLSKEGTWQPESNCRRSLWRCQASSTWWEPQRQWNPEDGCGLAIIMYFLLIWLLSIPPRVQQLFVRLGWCGGGEHFCHYVLCRRHCPVAAVARLWNQLSGELEVCGILLSHWPGVARCECAAICISLDFPAAHSLALPCVVPPCVIPYAFYAFNLFSLAFSMILASFLVFAVVLWVSCSFVSFFLLYSL